MYSCLPPTCHFILHQELLEITGCQVGPHGTTLRTISSEDGQWDDLREIILCCS